MGDSAPIVEALLPPGPQHDLDALLEPFASLVLRDSHPVVLEREQPAPDPPVETPAAENVDEGKVLGQADRIVEGHQADGAAESDAPRARGQMGEHELRARRDAAVGREVVLGDPHAVEAELFGAFRERGEILQVALRGLHVREVVEDTRRSRTAWESGSTFTKRVGLWDKIATPCVRGQVAAPGREQERSRRPDSNRRPADREGLEDPEE